MVAVCDYAGAVARLLELGQPASGEADESVYRSLGIQVEHVADLRRMVSDKALHETDGDRAAVWAPIHAWRALAELMAVEAVPELVALLDRMADDDEWVAEEIPGVLAKLGAPALEPVFAYLRDTKKDPYARGGAVRALGGIAVAHPELKSECVACLAAQLENFLATDRTLNATLIDQLAELKALETAPLIQQAFEAGRVDVSLRGDWHTVEYDLGLTQVIPPQRNFIAEEFPDLAEAAERLRQLLVRQSSLPNYPIQPRSSLLLESGRLETDLSPEELAAWNARRKVERKAENEEKRRKKNVRKRVAQQKRQQRRR